jgi:radical SAM superfamily enzyme YgiQ (UPF0313 family)
MTEHRVAFVHIVTGATVSYSHAVASLAGGLLRSEVRPENLRVFVLRDEMVTDFSQSILDFEPSIVLFSVWSNQWHRAVAVGTSLKAAAPRLPLWVGGVHVTAVPSSIPPSPFDCAVAGEGEDLVSAIVREPRKHPLTRTINGRLVEKLDDLPTPVLEIFSRDDIREYPSVMFSRGCPYQCTYCMSRNGGLGGTVRWKSPERAVQEILDLVRYAGPEEFYIDDDTFLKNPKWVRAFCKLYTHTASTPFYCNARPETVRLDLLQLLRDAGCSGVGIGIESGSESIRERVLMRPMTDETIIAAFATAREAGLLTWSFNMVGIPGETPADINATIELNEKAAVDFVRVSVFTPYPGTPLYSAPNAQSWAESYFRDAAGLEPEAYELYTRWVKRLESEGRLWMTESEKLLPDRL